MNKIEKRKLIHVLNSVGGVDVSLRIITENIDPIKFENIVIHGKNDTSKPFLDKNGNILKEYKLPIYREIGLFKDLACIYQTIKIFRTEKPDIVHAHSAKGGIVARAASLFYPVIVFHTPQAYSFLSESKGVKRFIFLHLEKLFRHFNSVLVASSPSEWNRGVDQVGYKKNKAFLFNNSILPIELDKEDNSSQNEYNFPKEYVCTVGRPSFQKNIEMMIEAIYHVKKELPNIHLVLMGVGEYSPNIKNVETLIDRLDLKNNVSLIKWMQRNNIFNIVSNAKLYISTARYEGLPYSIIESLSLGKACVVTDVDGNRDLVENGYNGYLVKEGEAIKMAQKILKLYNDDELRDKFEKNSKHIFDKKYNILKNISVLERIYNEQLET